jgi:hypothetical protein
MGGAAQEVTLTLPTCPQTNLTINYIENEEPQPVNLLEPSQAYPQIDGSPKTGTVSKARLLTKGDSVKTTLEVTVKLENRDVRNVFTILIYLPMKK